MKYVVTGNIRGEPHSITWEKRLLGKARLSGSPLAITLARFQATVLPFTGPVGCYMEPDLNDPLAALFIFKEVFDEEGLEVTGDVPQPPGTPGGVIT